MRTSDSHQSLCLACTCRAQARWSSQFNFFFQFFSIFFLPARAAPKLAGALNLLALLVVLNLLALLAVLSLRALRAVLAHKYKY